MDQLRALVIFVSVVAGGALLGVASVFHYWMVMAEFTAMAGALMGLILSPWTMYILWYRRLWLAWPAIYVPTACGAMLISRYGDVATSFGATVCLFVVVSSVVAMFVPERPDLAGLCRFCGYNLRGLPTPRCPECGLIDGEAE